MTTPLNTSPVKTVIKMSFSDIKITFILGGYSILDSYPNSSDVIKFDYLYIPNLDSTKSKFNTYRHRFKAKKKNIR